MKQKMVISPSGQIVAISEHTSITLYSLEKKAVMIVIDKIIVRNVEFTYDEKNLIINTGNEIKIYQIQTKKWLTNIYEHSLTNNFVSMLMMPGKRQIMISNHSTIITYNMFKQQAKVHQLQEPRCSGNIYSTSQISNVITVSYDCFICSFSHKNGSLQFIKFISISQCRLGEAILTGKRLILVQGSVMNIKPSILEIQTTNLKEIGKYFYDQLNLSVTSYRNYILVVSFNNSTIFIYKDSINNLVGTVHLFPLNIIDIAFQGFNNSLWVLIQDSSTKQRYVQFYSLQAFCNSTQNNHKGLTKCTCTQGQSFQLSSTSCIKNSCLDPSNSKCPCPSSFSFDIFSMRCKLNCSQVYDSIESTSFSNPQRCYCRPPFTWNSQLSDCSNIDCSYINNSNGKTNSLSSCTCVDGYSWNKTSSRCHLQESMINGQNGSSISAALVIFICLALIVVIILIIIFVYRRYRQKYEDDDKPYVPYQMKKVLDQVPTHRTLDPQPQQLPPPKQEVRKVRANRRPPRKNHHQKRQVHEKRNTDTIE